MSRIAGSVRRFRRRERLLRAERHANLRAAELAYLSGDGLEIGPLQKPFPLPPGSRITYVDQCDRAELARRNPDIPSHEIIAPNVVSDGHELGRIPDGAFDFVVASHVIEHLHNPLRALLEWRRVLRSQGRVLCVVPDGRFTFDAGRPFTSVEHLVWDYENDGSEHKALSDLFHIAECHLNMQAQSATATTAVDAALSIRDESNDSHFHVWSAETFGSHLRELRRDWGLPFGIVAWAADGTFEMVYVLEATDNHLPAALARRTS